MNINVKYVSIQFYSMRILILFLSFFTLGNSVYSNDSEEELRQVSFQSISWSMQLTDLWFNDDSGKKVDILPLPHLRGKENSTKVYNKLYFYSDKVDSEGAPIPVGQVSFSNVTNKFLLLFMKKSDSDYTIVAIPDDYKSFPFGSVRIYNATSFEIGYRLNEEQYALSQMKSAVHKLKNFQNINSTAVMIAFKAPDSTWKRGYNNRWGFDFNTRTLVFVTEEIDALGNKAVIVKRIKERQKTYSSE
jgi:hypothetical protein